MTNPACYCASTDDGLSYISLHRLPFDYVVSNYALTLTCFWAATDMMRNKAYA